MGKTIVSWSPVHGQSGTTSNVAALAAVFAIEYPSRSLITHTQLTFSSLESLFGKQLKGNGFEDRGMTALARLVKSDLLNPEAVMDYTETIFENRLDILSGTKKKHSEENLLETLLHVTRDAYDLVWIDAHSGTRNELTNRLLQNADIVLVNLPQNRFVLDRFFISKEDYPEVLKDKEVIVLISSYDEDSTFSIRKIKRLYKTDCPIYPILYSHHFKDAANQLALSEFFFRNLDIRKEQSAFNFIQAIKKVNKVIAKNTELYRTGEVEVE